MSAQKNALTFTQAVDAHRRWCQAANYSQSTVEGYTVAYQFFIKHLGQDPLISAITADHIEAFMAWAITDDSAPRGGIPRPPRRRKPKTVLNYYIALSSLWTWAVKRKMAAEHVVKQVKPLKVNKEPTVPLTKEQMGNLFQATRRSRSWSTNPLVTTARPTHQRDNLILCLLYDTMIRAEELCQLRIRDITFDRGGGSLYIWGKGNKPRMVYFATQTKRALREYLAARPGYKPDERLILTDQGRPMNRNSLAKLVKRLGEKIGIRVTPHLLRITGACHRLNNGLNVVDLQRVMGHSDVKTTMRYVAAARQNEEDIRRTSPVDRLD